MIQPTILGLAVQSCKLLYNEQLQWVTQATQRVPCRWRRLHFFFISNGALFWLVKKKWTIIFRLLLHGPKGITFSEVGRINCPFIPCTLFLYSPHWFLAFQQRHHRNVSDLTTSYSTCHRDSRVVPRGCFISLLGDGRQESGNIESFDLSRRFNASFLRQLVAGATRTSIVCEVRLRYESTGVTIFR